MKGIIVMWSGAIGEIPAGWQLCDGTNGTPDLRDRFLIGAGTTYNPDDSGGAETHTHDFTSDGHSHNTEAGTDLTTVDPNSKITTVFDTGTTNPTDHKPPYYALAFIQKI